MTDLGYDSLAVPESGDVVTYLEQQCIPRYLIGFERRVEPQLQLLNGRYELKSANLHNLSRIQTRHTPFFLHLPQPVFPPAHPRPQPPPPPHPICHTPSCPLCHMP